MASQKVQAEKSKFVRLERENVREISNFLFALGNKFVDVKNMAGAFDAFKYSLDLDQFNQPAAYNIGCLYMLNQNLEGAYKMFAAASRMQPSDLSAKIALAEAARKLGKTDESLKLLTEVQKVDPENYSMMSAMAILHYDQGRLAEALAWNERAMEKKPGDVSMRLNKALVNMAYGRWRENWSDYEFCLSYNKNERMRHLRMSDAWAGQEMPGKTLIVVSDQGSGDAIQMSRYLIDAKNLGKFGKLVFLIQPDLKDLLGRVQGVDEVVGFGERDKVDYDAFASLLGVMRVLQVSPENCRRPPHVVTDPRLDEVWAERIGRLWDGQSKKIALVWAGDPAHGADHLRSIPLPVLAPLMNCADVQFFSFQVGRQVRELADPKFSGVVDLGSDFRNYDDTASALKQMDLLISCDTSVAHLGGCLGVPTWWLIQRPPEWRHLLVGNESPWYSDTRLFRQREPRLWTEVAEVVATELGAWAR